MRRCRGELAGSDTGKVNLIMWPCTHWLPFNRLTSWCTCTPASHLEQPAKTITMPRGLESPLPLKSTWQQMIFCTKT